jgi:hypothetical protein
MHGSNAQQPNTMQAADSARNAPTPYMDASASSIMPTQQQHKPAVAAQAEQQCPLELSLLRSDVST